MSNGALAEYDGASFGELDGMKRLGLRALSGVAILGTSAMFGLWIVCLRPTERPVFPPPPPPQTASDALSPYGELALSIEASSASPRSDSVAAPPPPILDPHAIERLAASRSTFAQSPYGALAELSPAVSPQTLALRSSLDLDLEGGSSSTVAAAPPLDAPLPPRRPSGLGGAPSPTPPAVASSAPPPAQSAPGFFERLFGSLHPAQGQVVAYAAPETTTISRSAPQSAVLRSAAPWSQPSALSRYDKFTAVYDIEAKTVYLPNGTRLEAHSGLGDRKDDPKFVNEHARGATPPDVYELSLREGSFHGVQALRLKPVGSGEQFGRTGLLAHPYMLGAEGDSFGCVSFKDYDAFLQAFQAGQVKKLAVVAKLD